MSLRALTFALSFAVVAVGCQGMLGQPAAALGQTQNGPCCPRC